MFSQDEALSAAPPTLGVILFAAPGAAAVALTDPFMENSRVPARQARLTDRPGMKGGARTAYPLAGGAKGFRQDKAGDANRLMLQGYRA